MVRFGWMANGTMRHLACLLASAVGTLWAQDAGSATDPTIRVDVKLVRILATVKDSTGALVGSLQRGDFDVRDNGVRQNISVFERQTEQPLSVAVLIDNSGSTAKDLKYETESVTRFLKALFHEGNPEDAAALYSFNWQVVRQNNFTRSVAAVERNLRFLRGDAGTSLYDAILLASRDIEDRRGRKVLVVVTDGGDTTSRSDFQRAVEAAQLADVVIYPILVVPVNADAGRNTGGENALTTIALRTGGRVFQPTLGSQMDAAFDQILRDLRTQYLIGFYPRDVPPTKDRYHSLRVGVQDPTARVVARDGYYGEAVPETIPVSGGGGPGPAMGEDQTLRPRKPPVPKVSKGKGP